MYFKYGYFRSKLDIQLLFKMVYRGSSCAILLAYWMNSPGSICTNIILQHYKSYIHISLCKLVVWCGTAIRRTHKYTITHRSTHVSTDAPVKKIQKEWVCLPICLVAWLPDCMPVILEYHQIIEYINTYLHDKHCRIWLEWVFRIQLNTLYINT